MHGETIQVLLVEDDLVDAASVARLLRRDSPSFEVHVAVALQQALDSLGKRDVDVVLLDLFLPDSDGVPTVRRMREADGDVPIVVLTGADDEPTAIGALKAGAQDYLVKSELEHPSLLVRAIRYAIERQAMREENDQLAEQLRFSERMLSLGALASGMTLGFNTLLGNVLEQAEAGLEVLASPASRASVRRNLIAIRREVMRACQMTDQLRDFCGGRATISHPIDLSAFVAGVSRTLAVVAGGSQRVRYELQESGPIVMANRLQLYQILVALTANGVEALGEQPGSVCVATGRLEADRDLLSRVVGLYDAAAGSYAFLEVSDTGCGMDAATRKRIFEPFFTTKLVGRGLGLAAVVGIARQLGAGVQVESTKGGGTSVRLLMPAFDAADAEEEPLAADVTGRA